MGSYEIIGYLLSAYGLGWAWGKSMLAFKQFSETAS